LEKAKIEGDNAPKHIPLIKFEKENREKGDPKHNPHKQLKKSKIKGGRCSQPQST
jgi:hypothetical protein